MASILLNELEPYLPSSSEKKQAVMMYMAVGLVLSMWKWEVSPFTNHHLKQSLGWLVFLVLIIFGDLVLAVLWMVISFFGWLAVLITIPALIVWAMWIYQAQQGKYIWENEVVNKFFLFFSWIGNRTLSLFDANHYQVIDAERYRTEDQFYTRPSKEKESNDSEHIQSDNVFENWNSAIDSLNIQNHEINNEPVNAKNLDNEQQISINNQGIWIDLSGHEINDSEDFKLEL